MEKEEQRDSLDMTCLDAVRSTSALGDLAVCHCKCDMLLESIEAQEKEESLGNQM
jgi:hypothetical protein